VPVNPGADFGPYGIPKEAGLQSGNRRFSKIQFRVSHTRLVLIGGQPIAECLQSCFRSLVIKARRPAPDAHP
jgi:hypothetical protein